METRDLDENTLLDLDEDAQLCSMTIEHAKERVCIPEIDYQQIAAQIDTAISYSIDKILVNS
ncbi:DUF2283 domain-containing protein [Pseudanabaena sp. Chao 1811]|uniref:DUF2283 domain-containing protein n=1 Tax=Pseudanabaena sp. Chao 1811 TaxID=2963092 RepID=UPI0022F3E5F4|nr:DUF2283 domain-containing protein [Pseudanabaena sp. Chao 1811]